ncbi:MAG: hypothetical protein U0528_10345 [Anaerolineae bacterium]
MIEEADEPATPPHKIVLAIDDEVGMINLYRRYLMRGGYEVISARPEEAEELSINYSPRVILLDAEHAQSIRLEVLTGSKKRCEENGGHPCHRVLVPSKMPVSRHLNLVRRNI